MHMVLTRPLKLSHDVEALFDMLPRQAGHLFGRRDGHPADQARVPQVDILESDENLTLRFALPGFAIEDLEVRLDDDVLTVEGARQTVTPEGAVYRRRELPAGRFTRSIRVADHFDPEQVRAELSNGILEVALEKRPDALPRTIEIRPA